MMQLLGIERLLNLKGRNSKKRKTRVYFTIWFHCLAIFKLFLQIMNNFVTAHSIRFMLLQTHIQITYLILLCLQQQIMQFTQSFNTLRSRTLSHQDRPLIYKQKLPSYKEKNIRDTKNIFPVRHHSSKSNPLQFLKDRQKEIPKTTSVSSEEQKLKDKIARLEAMQDKSEDIRASYHEEYMNYQKGWCEANQREDKDMKKNCQFQIQQWMRKTQQEGRTMDRRHAVIMELKKQLKQIQGKKI